MIDVDFDVLEKAMGHKYVKRTGTPGNYKYWYKMPDGSIQVGDDAQQAQGRIEHVKRLAAGKEAGVHSMTGAEIAAHTGHDPGKTRSIMANVATARRNAAAGTGGRQPHDFNEHHMKEAVHADVTKPEYTQDAQRSQMAPSHPGSVSGSGAAPGSTPASMSAGSHPGDQPSEATAAAGRVAGKRAARQAGFEVGDRGDASRQDAHGRTHEIHPDTDTREGHTHALRVSTASGTMVHSSTHPSMEAAAAESQRQEARRGKQSPAAPAASGPSSAASTSPVPTGGAPASAARPDAQPAAAQGDAQAARKAELRAKLQAKGYLKPAATSKQRAQAAAAGGPSPARQAATERASAPRPEGSGGENAEALREARPAEPGQQPAQPAQHDPGAKYIGTLKGKKIMKTPDGKFTVGDDQAGADQQKHASLREAIHSIPGTSEQERKQFVTGTVNRLPASWGVSIPEEHATQAEGGPHPDAHPDTPHARELARSDPDFGASEAHVATAAATHASGGNPYLDRASEIFHRIQGDLKPERKEKVKHMFAAMAKAKASGEPVTEENVLKHYKAIEGNGRMRTLPKEDFEKATFHTSDEAINNPPVNPEHERMMRGYATKQFARIKPFLKDSWQQSHPSAPPPMPTFGDIKSWGEHGAPKPTWAGNTKIALPKEVFDAAHKSPDGKPKYPPPWMPIHLMPVWNYAAKNMEKEKGASIWEAGAGGRSPAYAADKTPTRDDSSPTGWKVDMGNQARSGAEFAAHGPEGMIVNAMRKYVQMRGGPDQLVDIPQSKMADAGTTHADVFKAEAKSEGELSDKDLMKLSTTKIIDPVALLKLVKQEMKGGTVKKSIELVVDLDAPYQPILKKAEPKLFFVDLEKAAKIKKIEGILRDRQQGA